MTTYEVKQFQTHQVTFRVEAENEEEAIERVLEGTADLVEDSEEFIESSYISSVEEV